MQEPEAGEEGAESTPLVTFKESDVKIKENAASGEEEEAVVAKRPPSIR